MSHIFPRNARDNVPKAVGAEGCYIIDSSGKRYLMVQGALRYHV